ncbi:transposase [Paraburkholderia sp. BL6665CI2N2]|uniref:IS66-like element accessory protein TnpA n=1 Tax=Paraburkholderia sp. BL6665CI2N2 TaxID=1938806 RepID=UPI0010660EE5|nr:transposase [Paraburkholderia sp. BL6665CI2N2]
MNEKKDLKSRLVIGMKRDGRREYDESALEELVEQCLKPGVSIARMAIDHDVNPNQLRKWIARYQQRLQARDPMPVDGVAIDMVPTGLRAIESSQSAFVPVVAAPSSTSPTSSPQSMTLALHVRLSNGVELELGKAIASIDELTTLVQILGRLPCSGSTKG